jgi:hypothetical protein
MNALARLQALLAQAANPADLTPEQLSELPGQIAQAAADAVAESAEDVTLEALDQAAAIQDGLAAEINARNEDAQARSDRAQAALDRIAAQVTPVEPEPDPEPLEDPEPEPEPALVGETVSEPELIAATGVGATPPSASAPVVRTPQVTHLAARGPIIPRPAPPVVISEDPADWNLTASANAPGIQAGSRITNEQQLAAVLINAWESTQGFQPSLTNPEMKLPIAVSGPGRARTRAAYGDDRYLDNNEIENERKILAATSRERREELYAQRSAIVASGGICAPQQVNYDLPVIGENDRPVRDGLMQRFGADRGGIRTLGVPVLSDVTSSVGVWTAATDASPGQSVKGCMTLACPSETQDLVEAIYYCLKVGNFRAKYFPEQIRSTMQLIMTWQARFAERRRIADIANGSTHVTTASVFDTNANLMAVLDHSVARFRSYWRDRTIPLEFGIPAWLFDNMRASAARQMPFGTQAETLAVADAEIMSWFSARRIVPTLLMDGESGQEFTAQVDGGLQPWPSHAYCYLFPTGAWLFLDGGELDLGIVRDSTLVQTNDFKMFAETFEGSHFHGVESQRLDIDICPSGVRQALATVDPCTSGS